MVRLPEKLNSFFGFRCTEEEKKLLEGISKTKGGKRKYILDLHNNTSVIDWKAVRIIVDFLKPVLEPDIYREWRKEVNRHG